MTLKIQRALDKRMRALRRLVMQRIPETENRPRATILDCITALEHAFKQIEVEAIPIPVKDKVWQIDTLASDEEYLWVDIPGRATVCIQAGDDGLTVELYDPQVQDGPVTETYATWGELCGDERVRIPIGLDDNFGNPIYRDDEVIAYGQEYEEIALAGDVVEVDADKPRPVADVPLFRGFVRWDEDQLAYVVEVTEIMGDWELKPSSIRMGGGAYAYELVNN